MAKRLLVMLLVAAAAAVAAPSVSGAPPGAGLYGEHLSHCWGAFTWGTKSDPRPVVLVPGNGNSFWVGSHHLVILSAEVTDLATRETTQYTFGAKTGQAAGATVTCEGDFPGYHVVSHDVVVP